MCDIARFYNRTETEMIMPCKMKPNQPLVASPCARIREGLP